MKNKYLIFGAVFFTALFILSVGMVADNFVKDRQNTEIFEKIYLNIESKPDDETVSSYDKYISVYEQNNDFVGWIKIDGTNIDYPVMQSKANPNFYLKRNFEKQYSDYGVPYLAENCNINVSDNLIIYGHNMKNGKMFGNLCKYKNKNFYENHKYIYFDTLKEYGKYEIISVFKTSADTDDFEYYTFSNAKSPDEYKDYVDKCKMLSLYDTDNTAKFGERLLTLSTCEYSQNNGRLVVVAKQIEANSET